VKARLRGTARAEVPGRLLDLSLGGALLHLQAGLVKGEIHDFALDLDGETVWVQGEVRRCDPAPRGGYEVGMEFVGIDPRDQRRLESYLKARG
jgi:c-di-GMP-binding flagellar brake protein YcgR